MPFSGLRYGLLQDVTGVHSAAVATHVSGSNVTSAGATTASDRTNVMPRRSDSPGLSCGRDPQVAGHLIQRAPAAAKQRDRLTPELRRIRLLEVRSPWHGGASFPPSRTMPTKRSDVHGTGGIPARGLIQPSRAPMTLQRLSIPKLGDPQQYEPSTSITTPVT